jgi:hypothetical protein
MLTVTLAACACLSAPARAFPGCDGALAATSLQPLPTPLVVAMDIHDQSPRNLALAERFKSGLNAAHVATEGAATVFLHVDADVAAGGFGSTEHRMPAKELEWGGVGLSKSMPGMSRRLSRGTGLPPTLSLRVDVTLPRKPEYLWVATLRCELTGMGDDGDRAETIGRLIGGAIGKTVRGQQF